MFSVSVIVLFLAAVLSQEVESRSRQKLLFINALATRSENEMFYPLINELAGRGHEITFLSSDPAAPSKIGFKNVTVLVPISYKELLAGWETFVFTPIPLMDWIFMDKRPFLQFCDRVFETEEFKEKVLKTKFDMILVNVFVQQCFYGLAHKDQAALVLINTFPLMNYMLQDLGSYAPTSIAPYALSNMRQDMTFWERTVNFLADWGAFAHHELFDVPLAEAVYRKHLGQHVPGIREIHRNVSLVLLNTDPLATPMRPVMPDVVEVGGLHLRKPKPLPKDIQDFVEGAEHGFIYFTLGTIASSNSMPKVIHDKLMRVFNKLKQRVFWKSGSETEGVIKSNVFMKNYFPQQDLLGHKNIRLFISHGGLFGTLESIYHGVPVLGMPVFFDQYANIQNAVSKGYALEADLRNFDEQELEDTINKLIEDQTFKQRVTEMSEFFKNQQNSPLERAVFNIERVLKHRNLLEFRTTSARKFNFLQFHSLDVIGFLLLVAFIILFAVKMFLLFMIQILKHLFSRSSSEYVYRHQSGTKKSN